MNIEKGGLEAIEKSGCSPTADFREDEIGGFPSL